MKTTSDYQRVARAIAFLRRESRRQPALADVAEHLGLSPAYTQRLFSRWVGVSPKRFVQHLTVEAIKRRMAGTADLLGLSLDAGLSGPGRLHDLFVTLEGMSPGEFRRAAAGLTLSYGLGETPFGRALILSGDRGIIRLAFVDGDTEAACAALRREWPMADLREDSTASQAMLDRVFTRDPASAARGLSLWVPGSNFQIQVWRALLRVPSGGLLSYRQLATLAGRPGAARAVGSAVAANPIAFLIPCHRVLRTDGGLGGYHWGGDRKAAMVGWEANRGPSG